jgi:hypothetical protein
LLFGFVLAFDVFHAVLEVNRVSLWSQEAPVIATAAVVVVGIPGVGLFLAVCRLFGRATRSGAAASCCVALAGLFGYGAASMMVDSSEMLLFVRNHLGLACFLILALFVLSRTPQNRLALFTACAAGITMTVSTGARNVPYAAVAAQADGLRVHPPPFGGRILLLGVDGLGWDTLQRWAHAHFNADYAWLSEHGVQAPLDTLMPTLSPRIWSSIATGVPPDEHGVVGFTSLDYAGLHHSRLLSPRFEGAFYWARLLEQCGAARRLPVSSLDLRKPAVWEIVGRPAEPVDVLGWWATWPAQPLAGRMVSDRFYFSRGQPEVDEAYANANGTSAALASLPRPQQRARSVDDFLAGLTFPAGLAAELAPLRRAPAQMTDSELAVFLNGRASDSRMRAAAAGPGAHDPGAEIRYGYTSDETWFAVAARFLDDAALNATMIAYFRGLDMVSHGAMRFSHLYAETRRANRDTGSTYSEVVCHYYENVFARLRKLIEKAGENSVVLIVSDHGFEPAGDGEFGHYHAPRGVWMALGGGRRGVDLTPHHVYDIAPTLLWLRGYPEAEDMPGRAQQEWFPDLPAGEHRKLATYGYRLAAAGASQGDTKTDQEMMRLLKTLGYVK